MARLFAGVELSMECRERVRGMRDCLAARLTSDIRWARPETWHVTLKFLGEVDGPGQDAVCGALGGVGLVDPFPVRLGGCGCFPPLAGPSRTGGHRGAPRVVWAGVRQGGAGLTALAARVEDALAQLGFARSAAPFVPHLTLGRVRRAAPDDWAAVLAACGDDTRAGQADGRGEWPVFPVDGFALWRSVLDPRGAGPTLVRRFGRD